MIRVGMLAKIRRLHLRDGLSIREVSRRTGLPRNTVRQWLRQEGVTEPKYPKREIASAVDAWAEHLASALKAGLHRPVRERRTAKMLFEQIRALGYGGAATRGLDYLVNSHAGSATLAENYVGLPLG